MIEKCSLKSSEIVFTYSFSQNLRENSILFTIASNITYSLHWPLIYTNHVKTICKNDACVCFTTYDDANTEWFQNLSNPGSDCPIRFGIRDDRSNLERGVEIHNGLSDPRPDHSESWSLLGIGWSTCSSKNFFFYEKKNFIEERVMQDYAKSLKECLDSKCGNK